MHRIQYSVPGNMIIFGEYYITEQGSSALCCAVNTRAHITIDFFSAQEIGIPPNTPLLILLECIYNNENVKYKTPEDCNLLSIAKKLYAEYESQFQPSSDYHTTTVLNTDEMKFMESQSVLIKAVVDTNNFYLKKDNGITEKLGLGSSETSAILFSMLAVILQNRDPLSNVQSLARYAAQVHYIWQGNKGSGYGVYTSIFGGVGIFYQATDLAEPSWSALDVPSEMYWYYRKGQKNIISKNAITAFQNWKKQSSQEYVQLEKEVSNHLAQVQAIFKDKHAMRQWFIEARTIGERLGQHIGIDARLNIDDNEHEIVWKATGAGNESALGISFYDYRQDMHDMHTGSISIINIDEGLRKDE